MKTQLDGQKTLRLPPLFPSFISLSTPFTIPFIFFVYFSLIGLLAISMRALERGERKTERKNGGCRQRCTERDTFSSYIPPVSSALWVYTVEDNNVIFQIQKKIKTYFLGLRFQRRSSAFSPPVWSRVCLSSSTCPPHAHLLSFILFALYFRSLWIRSHAQNNWIGY